MYEPLISSSISTGTILSFTVAMSFFFVLADQNSLALHIQISYVLRILFNELTSRLYLVPHKDGKCTICVCGIFYAYLQNRSRLRIHRRHPQLFRIHLAEAFETRNDDAAFFDHCALFYFRWRLTSARRPRKVVAA